jgi:hypothetical protein
MKMCFFFVTEISKKTKKNSSIPEDITLRFYAKDDQGDK